MKKLGILAADEHLRDKALWAALAGEYEVLDYSAWPTWDEATLLARLREVEVLVTGRKSPQLPAGLAGNFGHLKWVAHLHGTIRHLVAKPLIEAGLIVTNWGDAVKGVAEGAMALLFACLKQLPAMDHWSRTGEDRRTPRAFADTLSNADVGLYGFGPIGRHMGRMLEAFGATVAVYDPHATDLPPHVRRCATLRELFSTCAILSIHCGLNEATAGSVTRELLMLLPQGGILINTARGGIVVEEDLAAVVADGRIWAGIDVIADEHGANAWERTPLAKLANVILTRHKVGGQRPTAAGPPAKFELPEFLVRNLRAFADGEPLAHVITAGVYDLKT